MVHFVGPDGFGIIVLALTRPPHFVIIIDPHVISKYRVVWANPEYTRLQKIQSWLVAKLILEYAKTYCELTLTPHINRAYASQITEQIQKFKHRYSFVIMMSFMFNEIPTRCQK